MVGAVTGMDFQENPAYGSRETAKKILCSASKIPFITARSERKLQPLKSKRGYSCVWSVRKKSL